MTPTEEPAPDDRAVKAAAGVISTVTTSAVGLVLGGPAGALLGSAAAPLVEPYVEKMVRDVAAELDSIRWRFPGRTLETAGQVMGVPVEDVPELAYQTPEGTELLYVSMIAAWETFNEQKAAALGRALGNGLADDRARIDEERLIMNTLAQLDTPHIRFLGRYAIDGPSLDVLDVNEIAAEDNVEIGSLKTIFGTLERVEAVTDDGRTIREQLNTDMVTWVTQMVANPDKPPTGQNPAWQLERYRTRGPNLSQEYGRQYRLTLHGLDCLRYLKGLPRMLPGHEYEEVSYDAPADVASEGSALE